MRCYFMKLGHIIKVKLLDISPKANDLKDATAIKQAAILFSECKDKSDGFEIWERERFVYRHVPLKNA